MSENTLEVLKGVDPEVLKVLVGLIQGVSAKASTSGGDSVQVKVDLPQVELKLDGPGTYLSWSRRIETALVGRKLEGYLRWDEAAGGLGGDGEWKATHALVKTWLLNSMKQSIATSVDGIFLVRDIWAKLKRTYGGAENHMRVFQIQQEINSVVQGNMTIQEYSLELAKLWGELDYFSQVSSCGDPNCKQKEFLMQMRTMHFLGHLNSAFHQRRSVLLAQKEVPSLDEAVAAMLQEESRMQIHT